MMHYLSEWHHFVYGILTVLFFLVYIIHFLPSKKIGRLKSILETETILVLVLIFVAVIASRVEHVADNADERWEQVNIQLQKLAKQQGFEEFKEIKTTESSFRQLSEALGRAEREVWATALRPDAPVEHAEYTGEAAQWYDNLDRWVSAESGRTYLRLVGLTSEETRDWLQKECANQSKIGNRLFKGIEWDADMPFMNMVVFDDDEVFLLFRPDPKLIEQTIRYRVKGSEMARLAREQFKAMWAAAKGCGELE